MRRFAFAILAALVACAPPAPDVRAPAADETSITALVSAVEDSGYPRFTVQVSPEGGGPVPFYLNAESGVDLDGAEPGAFEGQTALIYYTSTSTPFLLDLRTAEGRSLLYDDGRGVPTEGASITGVLSGASGVTISDLPDDITITSSDGQAVTFEFFIDRRIAAANGRTLTAYYDMEERREITLMRPLPDAL